MDTADRYPRLLRRVRAVLIDSVITVVVVASWWALLPVMEAYPVALKVAYPLGAWLLLDPVLVWRMGSTPGHYLMKLRVVSAGTGRNVGLLRAVVRSMLKLLSGWWSFVFALMTRRHQALHDVLTHTVVVLRQPEALPEDETRGERVPDLEHYRYPSRTRRLVVMAVYLVASVAAIDFLTGSLLSTACIYTGRCGTLDTAIWFGLSVAWFLGIATLLVCGWRARIYGARRTPLGNSD